MNKLWMGLLFPLMASSTTLDIGFGSLSTGQTASSSSFTDVLSVGYVMPSAGSALVLSTYSVESLKKELTGSWRLYDSGSSVSSSTINRYVSSNKDIGIASSMHVFSGLASGASSLSLQHSASVNSMNTFGANVVVIPLVTSGGDHLNYGLNTMSAPQSVVSQSFTDSGLATSVEVNRSTGNGIYIATSFNTRTAGSSAEVFNSQLQYRRSGSDTWINLGTENRRSLSGVSDTGSITLYGAVDGLESGVYDVRVAAKTATANAVEVLNGELAAVAMSYTNSMGGGYFKLLGATSAGGDDGSNAFKPIPGVLADVDAQENEDVFASMSFGGVASVGANQTASFRLSITNETGVVQSTVENSRYFSKTDDYGSGGAVGVFTNLTAGTYTVAGEHKEDTGPTITENVTLVGFGTQAVPEPTTMAFLSLAGLFALVWRRLANQ